MESLNIPMAPPPPLPNRAPPPPPPQTPIVNGSSSPHLHTNGHGSQNGDSGTPAAKRQELMSEIREGVKLKASRDQILHCSRTPNGGVGTESLASALVSEGGANGDEKNRLKKTVNSELQTKFDEIDRAGSPVLPSKINPDMPGAPPPMHIPLSTAIRVLQERERKDTEMNQQRSPAIRPTTPTTPTATTPPQSRNGTLGRDATLSSEKLMISHGKRNFTIGSTPNAAPKKITIKNEKLVPKRNLLGGEGKMSSDLKKLLAADAENVEEPPPPPAQPTTPQIKSPQPRSSPDAFREKHLRTPEAIEISNTLRRLITQDKVDTVDLRGKVALPEDHKISDQLKRLILDDMQKAESVSTASSNGSQVSSVSSTPDLIEKRSPMAARPTPRHPLSSPISPSVKNGSLIDNSIRIPLPPRVPSPPPLDNPKRLDSQLSCDRLNREFQEFNAYRVINPPSPKKIAIPMDPNGAPNFEKKTVVSFSKELGAPNRYPDTVKVMKTVQNGIQTMGMGNIKFVIDPESSENVVQVSI